MNVTNQINIGIWWIWLGDLGVNQINLINLIQLSKAENFQNPSIWLTKWIKLIKLI